MFCYLFVKFDKNGIFFFNYYYNNDNLNFFNINICKYLCDLCYCKGDFMWFYFVYLIIN